MTGQYGQRGLQDFSETERTAYYELANEILTPANDLLGVEPPEEVAAAFLYACAMYNVFAMQVQLEDPSTIDAETLEYLVEEFRI